MILLTNSRLRRRLLTYVFAHPDENFYVRELSALIAEDPGNLSRELRRLEVSGLFKSSSRGKEKFYSLCRAYPLFKEIKDILSKADGIEGSLRGLVEEYRGIFLAFIYGSYAKGAEKIGSDIDLVIVGKFSKDDFTRAIRKLETKFSREINFNSYTPNEFAQERQREGGFLNLILKDKIIVLKGDLHG